MLKHGLKIAISGKSGCGNSTASKLLAQTLGLKLINYTFRNMAQEMGIEMRELCAMAEKDEKWDRDLDARQVEYANGGDCVLGSRLAIWLLPGADLKVYLTASGETRARRIAGRDDGLYEAVLAETLERDRRDRERYLRLYGIDNDKWQDLADLVIDTTERKPSMIIEDIIYNLRIKRLMD